SIFQATGAVRYLGEVTHAVALLVSGKRTVVGRHDLQRTGSKASPQRILMLLIAEWRAHHASGRMIPILVEIFALIQHQMLDQRLAEHAHALLARTADRLVALLAGCVHDIERHAGHVG